MASFRAWICATRSPPTCAVLRHEKGLSQDDLAYGAEISRCYLAQIEKGSYYASLKIIGRLVDALERDTPRVLRRVMGYPALKEPSRVLCWAAPIGEGGVGKSPAKPDRAGVMRWFSASPVASTNYA